jgi:hypothetical protein
MKEEQDMNGSKVFLLGGIAAMIGLMAFMTAPRLASSNAQNSITGQWIVSPSKADGSAQLTLQSTGPDWNINSSTSILLSQLRGLTAAEMRADGGMARFEIVRDAGTLQCEGRFKNGRGAGNFVFKPNRNYLSEMRSLGYDNLSDEQMFSFALHDVRLDFVRGLIAAGYERTDVDQLVSMRIHGVTLDFINDLRSLGYDRTPTDELVSMRIHGVSADFIRELKALGYERVAVDQLVSMRIHGVETDFVRELKEMGYDHVPADDLISMRIHGVATEFIKELKTLGYERPPVDELVSMKIHGVTPDFIRRR